jgi:hypothetical protein
MDTKSEPSDQPDVLVIAKERQRESGGAAREISLDAMAIASLLRTAGGCGRGVDGECCGWS